MVILVGMTFGSFELLILLACAAIGIIPAVLILFLISKLGLRAGTNLNYELTSERSADEMRRQIIASLSGVKNTTLSVVGDDSLIAIRKFIPSWAIVIAVISAFVFWPGMLVLFVKDSESLNIQLYSEDEQCRVQISGIANKEISDRLNLLA